MKLKLILTTVSLLLFSQLSFAQDPAQTCPGVKSIVEAGVTGVEPDGHSKWQVYNESHYDTDTDWFFVISNVPGQNEDEATKNAREIMPSVKFLHGPLFLSGDTSLCVYTNSSKNYSTFAIQTPGRKLNFKL